MPARRPAAAGSPLPALGSSLTARPTPLPELPQRTASTPPATPPPLTQPRGKAQRLQSDMQWFERAVLQRSAASGRTAASVPAAPLRTAHAPTTLRCPCCAARRRPPQAARPARSRSRCDQSRRGGSPATAKRRHSSGRRQRLRRRRRCRRSTSRTRALREARCLCSPSGATACATPHGCCPWPKRSAFFCSPYLLESLRCVCSFVCRVLNV